MALYRRSQTWHAHITIPGGKRIRQALGTTNKRQAQELHDKLRIELWRVDKLGDFPSVTFEEACLRWLDEKTHKKSLDMDKSRLAFWLEQFEGVSLKDITDTRIYAAVKTMKHRNLKLKIAKSVADSTKARYLALIKSILRAAEREWKWLEKAPVIKIAQPKNGRIRWLTPHEAKRLIESCPEPLKSVVRFALATGLRRSNIVDLHWQQIDLTRKVAWILPEESKSGRAIGVALNATACEVLALQRGKHAQWVFVHSKPAYRNDGTLTPAVRKMRVDDNRAWRTALKKANIKDFRFHDLRHTWASWLIQSGVPLSVLQEMGGWESIEMVRRYADLAPGHLTAHAVHIDALLENHVTSTTQDKEAKLDRTT